MGQAMVKGWGKVKTEQPNLAGNAGFVREFIMAQFHKFPEMFGPEEKGGNIWIYCPFHDREHIHLANKVSMRINLADENFPIGHGYCFSCGKGGKGNPCTWNDIAEELGLRKLKASEMFQDHMISVTDDDREALGLTPERHQNMNRDITTVSKSSEKEDILIASIPWKAEQDWRTIKGSLISELGGRLWVNDRTLDLQLYLPVHMEGQYVGGIKCLLKKQEGQLSYVNTKGSWSSKALFPFDYVVKKFIKRAHKRGKKRVLFLVEGPRDALRLIQNGIPAVAFLGSSTKWSDYIGDLILQLEPDLVVLAFDADAPGIKATKKAFKFFRSRAKKIIRLKMAEGMDPAKLKPRQLKKIKRKLKL